MAEFKILSRHLSGETEEYREKTSQFIRSPERDLTAGTPEKEAGVLTTQTKRSEQLL
jgi:hypothetical protein